MNHSKLILSLSCFVAVTLASPLVTAAPRGGGGDMAVAIFPGVVVSLGVPEWGRGGRNGNGGRNWSGRNWNGRNWSGRNWNGRIGTVIGTVITITITLSSLVTSAFPAGGAGVGAGILTGATPITDTMIMVTRTVTTATAMAINIPATATAIIMGMGTAMDTPMEIVANTTSPTRSKVAELQRRLSRAGYYRGSVDGVLGPQTRRAIRAYESDHGYADAG